MVFAGAIRQEMEIKVFIKKELAYIKEGLQWGERHVDNIFLSRTKVGRKRRLRGVGFLVFTVDRTQGKAVSFRSIYIVKSLSWDTKT